MVSGTDFSNLLPKGIQSTNSSSASNQIMTSILPATYTLDELRQYALKKINEDRAKSNLPPVALDANQASQAHAEEILKTQKLSHWTTDGMKPYMRYTKYGGTYYVAQNIVISYLQGGDQLDSLHLQLCKSGFAICTATDPRSSIDSGEYSMMYDDAVCCNNGHRDNILDLTHTHVSIGIAYDASTFVMVQNFENQYIQWQTPITYDQSSDMVSMNGILDQRIKFQGINIFYDPWPTHQTYLDNFNRTSYDSGTLIAEVAEPAPAGSYYVQPSNYTLIEAAKWDTTNNSMAISFNLDNLASRYGDGVYTIYLWGQDNSGNNVDLANTSVFKNKSAGI
jgi:uncharacterized protein YkwD